MNATILALLDLEFPFWKSTIVFQYYTDHTAIIEEFISNQAHILRLDAYQEFKKTLRFALVYQSRLPYICLHT